MGEMLRVLLSLVLLLEGAHCGQYCKQYISEYTYYYKTYYCDGRCCGSVYDDACCEDRSSYIAAAVIGSIIAFLLLAAILVCAIKACTRSYHGGRVINPSPNVFVVNGVSRYERQTNTEPTGAFVIPQPPPYTSGPAPPYSPYGRKERFEPRPPSTNSLPPAYSTGQPQAGTSTSPAQSLQLQPQPQPQPQSQAQAQLQSVSQSQSEPLNPLNQDPAGGTEVPTSMQPAYPPPAYSTLNTQNPASGGISQVPAGPLSATAPVVDNSPSGPDHAGANGNVP